MKKPFGPRTDESARGLVDVAAIDQLATILAKYDLSEVEFDLGELHVRLARERTPAAPAVLAAAAAPAQPAAPADTVAEAAAEAPAVEIAGAVKSPMVGTAYLRPTPESKPFVEVGSMVKAGDKLLLVEAMKTFNDIVAPSAGRVAEILVSDGSPVEYGQPLMVIE